MPDLFRFTFDAFVPLGMKTGEQTRVGYLMKVIRLICVFQNNQASINRQHNCQTCGSNGGEYENMICTLTLRSLVFT
jgi:hypothetical protein